LANQDVIPAGNIVGALYHKLEHTV